MATYEAAHILVAGAGLDLALGASHTLGSVPEEEVAVQTRFTTGEFAGITRLSRKALRLYEELGLLRPAQVDPWTGYRTYTLDQAPRARAIALLRSVDLPLEAIAELLAATDEGTIRLLLDRHREQLEARLAEHRQMLLQVEQLIQRGKIMGLDAQVKTVSATTLWTEKFTCPGDPEQIGAAAVPAFERLNGALARAGITPSGPAWLRYLDLSGDEWTLEAGIPVAAEAAPPAGVHRTELPATRVAAAVHRGPYSGLGLHTQVLCDWAIRNGHQLTGPIFDVYLNDWTKVEPPSLETEVCVPV